MNILLSAYCCDPSRGSEYAVGWNWACELAKAGQRVWLMTAPFGKNSIEKACTSLPSLRVVYVDVPNFPKKTRFLPWKLCAIVDALFWRHRVLKAARDLNSKVEFDVVHHVSWSSLHVGSQLWKLGRPFVFGPIGGGQLAPGGFGHYLRGGWSEEFIRSLVVRYFTGTLLYAKSTVAHADLVLVANYETREWAERLGAARIEDMLTTGTSAESVKSVTKGKSDSKVLKILWVGRLLPRKGVLLALEALAQVDQSLPFTCTILGDGQQGRYLPGWVQKLGLADRVIWKRQVPWSEALAAYSNHDVFLFTSLRDTSADPLTEALASGNAIVTLDHHGARMAVPKNAGVKVPVTSPHQTAADLARAIERLANEPETLAAMGRNALEAATSQGWAHKIERAINLYDLIHCPTPAPPATPSPLLDRACRTPP
jgi:glycosyltransferase involved in cell wall biosynthesis